MNKILLSNRPKDSSAEDFIKAWDNSSYVLEALWKTLDQFSKETNMVKKDDFDCPNHYAKLAYQAGILKAFDDIKNLLPKSANPN